MKRVRRFRSLAFKLVLASVIVEVVMLTVLVTNTIRLVEVHLVRLAEARLQELDMLLNASLAPLLAKHDVGELSDVLQALRSARGISYLVLFDHQGDIIAESGWTRGEVLPDIDTVIDNTEDDHTYDTAIRIAMGGQLYGYLRFGMSTHFLDVARARILQQSLWIAGSEVILSIVLLGLIGYWMTRHLARLTRGSEAVAQGNFAMQLPVKSQDEIGQLTMVFNTMSAAVRARVAALQDAEEMQRQLAHESQQQQAQLSALLGAMNIGILFEDKARIVTYFNPALRRIWSIPAGVDLTGRLAEILLDVAKEVVTEKAAQRILQVSDAQRAGEASELMLTDGRVLTQSTYPVRDASGEHLGRLWVYEDITRERQTAQQLIYLAERDALTGLFNRHRFQEELSRVMRDLSRQARGALLFFDLDEFKYVNDTFGHNAGDAVLKRVANEVSALLREGELFCRLGGDEFAVLVPNITVESAQGLAERIVHAVSRATFNFESQIFHMTTSVGIAFYPQHAARAEELIAHADAAMYQAKSAGKNAWVTYRADLDSSRAMVSRMTWNERIVRALEQDGLRLHFQGIYHVNAGPLAHLEVLVRMADDEHEARIIMPGQFIPFAEKSGKIIDIDRWVIAESARLLGATPEMPPLAVNISGRSFDDPGLPRYIAEQLAKHNVRPGRLLVELTETEAVSDLRDAQRFMDALHAQGCRVCLDDFGAGFSSFAYLKHLKADILKIDGQFIRGLVRDKANQVFVKAMVDVALGLDKSVIAEYVEDAETLDMLSALGVHMVQGYHLDIPVANHPALEGRDVRIVNK